MHRLTVIEVIEERIFKEGNKKGNTINQTSLTITPEGCEQLMSCRAKEEYHTMCKYLHKETTHLGFEVKTSMVNMARRGYVSWAKKAGLLSI